jgi:hypothetical protein
VSCTRMVARNAPNSVSFFRFCCMGEGPFVGDARTRFAAAPIPTCTERGYVGTRARRSRREQYSEEKMILNTTWKKKNMCREPRLLLRSPVAEFHPSSPLMQCSTSHSRIVARNTPDSVSCCPFVPRSGSTASLRLWNFSGLLFLLSFAR